MYLIIIEIACGLATTYITKRHLYKKYPIKEFFFTREILWLIIFGTLFLSTLLLVNPPAPNDTRTIMETAPLPRGEIVENSLAIIFILFPILLASVYILDKTLARIKNIIKKQ